jgi:hypothetical protein
MTPSITLDVSHLLVAAVALLGPVLLKRLQVPAAPAPTAPIAPAPSLPPDVAAFLPLHGAVVNLLLRMFAQQQEQQPSTPPPAK